MAAATTVRFPRTCSWSLCFLLCLSSPFLCSPFPFSFLVLLLLHLVLGVTFSLVLQPFLFPYVQNPHPMNICSHTNNRRNLVQVIFATLLFPLTASRGWSKDVQSRRTRSHLQTGPSNGGPYPTSLDRGKGCLKDAAQPQPPTKGSGGWGKNRFPAMQGFPTSNPEPKHNGRKRQGRRGKQRGTHEMQPSQGHTRDFVLSGNKTLSMCHGVWSYFHMYKIRIS